MAKVVCESCGSSFPFERVKGMKGCPICGKSLDVQEENIDLEKEFNDKEIEDIDLEHPDMYFYSIDSEDKYEDQELRDVWCQCTTCREVNTIPYNKFDVIKSEYLILKKDLDLKCEECRKTITNLTIPRRPDGWRELNMWEKDYEHLPKCPTCSSTKIKKISATSKVASVAMWGLLSRKVHKQWHCDTCGSEW